MNTCFFINFTNNSILSSFSQMHRTAYRIVIIYVIG